MSEKVYENEGLLSEYCNDGFSVRIFTFFVILIKNISLSEIYYAIDTSRNRCIHAIENTFAGDRENCWEFLQLSYTFIKAVLSRNEITYPIEKNALQIHNNHKRRFISRFRKLICFCQKNSYDGKEFIVLSNIYTISVRSGLLCTYSKGECMNKKAKH